MSAGSFSRTAAGNRAYLKTGVENYIFWFDIGSGFEEPGDTPSPKLKNFQEYPPRVGRGKG